VRYGSGTRRVLGGALCAGALGAVWTPIGSAALPAAEELVPNTVARISDAANRDDETVTRAEFRHELVVARATDSPEGTQGRGDEGSERRRRRVIDSLLEAIWLRGEAAEMGIAVTRRQVQRLRSQVVRESFASAAEFREFLRESRLTRRDVYERVELHLIAARIQERIVAGASGEAEEQAAFRKFVDEFNEKWRSRTVCAPEYVTARCSNGPSEEG
jgi:hypothetical protein